MVGLLYVLPASDGKLQAFLPQVDGWRGTKAGTALYLVALYSDSGCSRTLCQLCRTFCNVWQSSGQLWLVWTVRR